MQRLLGQPPDAYYSFFALRFPRLLLTIFFLVLNTERVAQDGIFDKYALRGCDFRACAKVFAETPPNKRILGPSVPQEARSPR